MELSTEEGAGAPRHGRAMAAPDTHSATECPSRPHMSRRGLSHKGLTYKLAYRYIRDPSGERRTHHLADIRDWSGHARPRACARSRLSELCFACGCALCSWSSCALIVDKISDQNQIGARLGRLENTRVRGWGMSLDRSEFKNRREQDHARNARDIRFTYPSSIPRAVRTPHAHALYAHAHAHVHTVYRKVHSHTQPRTDTHAHTMWATRCEALVDENLRSASRAESLRSADRIHTSTQPTHQTKCTKK